MKPDSDNAALFAKLLQLINVDRRRPSRDALFELVGRFMMRVPFENISKLYYLKKFNWRRLPDLRTYVEGIECYNFGGTCYANNYYLHLLLSYLGYEVMLCGADMSNPDVHLTNIAMVDGREFLVDAGYAAPFVQPLPRDLGQEFVVSLGRDRYVLYPKSEHGNSLLELYREGELKHGYTVKAIPRRIEHFADVIDSSFHDSSTFMNSLLLVRCWSNRSLVIHNLSVIESQGTKFESIELASREELPQTIEEYFSIPRAVVREAISDLGVLGDSWT